MLYKKLSKVTFNFSTAENDFKTFVEIFTSSMNTTCKLSKPKTTKRNSINNPWITDSLMHSIETKHKLYKNWKRLIVSGHPEGSIEKREKYRNYNKSLKKLIKTAKYSYYSKKFINMKKTWQIINEIRGKNIRNIKPLFKYEDDIITDKKEIANKFNEYYASMAENMNKSVNDEIDNSRENTPSFQSYMDKQSEDSMYLSDCTKEEVWTTIRNLENGKSNDIPIKLIKNCAPVITPILICFLRTI